MAVPPEPPPELVSAVGAVEVPSEGADAEVAAVDVVDVAAWWVELQPTTSRASAGPAPSAATPCRVRARRGPLRAGQLASAVPVSLLAVKT